MIWQAWMPYSNKKMKLAEHLKNLGKYLMIWQAWMPCSKKMMKLAQQTTINLGKCLMIWQTWMQCSHKKLKLNKLQQIWENVLYSGKLGCNGQIRQ
jgi:hypothetical protein